MVDDPRGRVFAEGFEVECLEDQETGGGWETAGEDGYLGLRAAARSEATSEGEDVGGGGGRKETDGEEEDEKRVRIVDVACMHVCRE